MALIERISHKTPSITTNSVDVTVTLRSEEVAAISADLYIMRFGGEEEQIHHAAQAQRFQDSFFVVRVKLPMARCRYELRLNTSCHRTPGKLEPHWLKYTITTGDMCQTLLSSLEDPLIRKFGYAELSPAMQLHGFVLLAPLTYRIMVGRCHFLVYVDTRKALDRALASSSPADIAGSGVLPRDDAQKNSHGTPLWEEEQRAENPSSLLTTLFSERLRMQGDGATKSGRSRSKSPRQASKAASRRSNVSIPGKDTTLSPGMVDELQRLLRTTLEPNAQDSIGGVHMDVVLNNGECVCRLRERADFPGFFEGFFTFSDADAGSPVRLQFRTPAVHPAVYAPRLIAEWLVCRSDHFPINF